jgi:hypothetical protein
MTDLYETIRRDLLGNGGLLDPSKGSLADEGAPPKLLLAGVALPNKMTFASNAVSFMSKRYAIEFFTRESLRRKQPFTCLKDKTGPRCLFRRRDKISREFYGTASAKLACLLPKIITLEHSASAPGGNFDDDGKRG